MATTENKEIISLENRNAELEKLVAKQLEKLDTAGKELENVREQLIKKEKLANLGQLAAGIAHEIKNPMNFVNNFSEMSLEFVDEIFGELDNLVKNDTTEEIRDLLGDVKGNLKKINENGNRVDSILKSMLLHSRGGSGLKEPTDLNGLIKEYLNLAFHGMRAGKKAINVKIEMNLSESLGLVDLNAENFSRVILNLCKNAFDVMREKSLSLNNEDYIPTLSISTGIATNNAVIVEIEDNGFGVPDSVKEKLFQPFFTTKKGTEGTGLGLSITSDIIKDHNGSIKVESKENKYTKFIIELPRTN